MVNSVDPEQTALIGAVCFGSTLFVSILNSSVMLGNNLQQTTSADDIFRCIFFSALKGLTFRTKLTACVPGNGTIQWLYSVIELMWDHVDPVWLKVLH